MRNLARVVAPIGALISFTLFTARVTNAQSLATGVKIGLNLSSLPNAGSILDPVVKQASVETSSKAGGTFGGFLIAPLIRQFSFQPELMFTGKGVKLTEAGSAGTLTASLRYIEFPLLIRYSSSLGNRTAYLLFGPTFGIKASTSARIEGGGRGQPSDPNIDTAIGSFDGGIALAGGLHHDRYLFEVRYTQGVSDIGSDTIPHPTPVRNRVFAVLAGLGFN